MTSPSFPGAVERELPGFWFWFKGRYPQFAEYGPPDGPPVGFPRGVEVDEKLTEGLPAYIAALKERAGLDAADLGALAGPGVTVTGLRQIVGGRETDAAVELETDGGPVRLVFTREGLTELIGSAIDALGSATIEADNSGVRENGKGGYALSFIVGKNARLVVSCSPEVARGLNTGLFNVVGTNRLLPPGGGPGAR